MIIGIYPFGLPIALSLVGYNSLLTGLFVFFKRQDKVGFHYFVFSLSVFAWGVGVSFMLNSDLAAPIAQAWGRFSQACALFIPSTWLHFVLVYTEQKNRINRVINSLSFLIAITLLPFAAGRWFVVGFRPMVGVKFYPIPGVLYIVFTGLFCLTVSYTFWILYRSWKKAGSSEKKSDYKRLFFAQFYGFATGSLSFLPVYGIPLPQYNLLAMPLWQFLLAYSMVRYSLFDLEEVIQAVQKDKLAAMGLLSAGINHEIRTPLFVIKGHAETLLAQIDKGGYEKLSEIERKERIKQLLRKTIEQSERIVDIAHRLTDFSKPPTDREVAKLVILNEVVDNVLSFVGYGLRIDNIKIEKDIAPHVIIQVNQKHLEQILLNLILNACQAMPAGGDLFLKAYQENGRVHIKIQDTGTGISKSDQGKIFEPFHTTKGQKGTGLGLYVTKQLVKHNGGRIWLETSSHGTSFYLEFGGAPGTP